MTGGQERDGGVGGSTAGWYDATTVPRVLYEQGFSFSFFAADGGEPAHVHVRGSGGQGKWWLDPLGESWSRGFTGGELRKINTILAHNQGYLLGRWNDFFPGNRG